MICGAMTTLRCTVWDSSVRQTKYWFEKEILIVACDVPSLCEQVSLRARPLANGPALGGMSSHTLPNSQSQKDPSRHSPVNPLAPLEFLQSQRRGSITDPSLHATPKQNINSQFFRPSAPHDKNNLSEPRPSSPYVFGSATHAADNAQLRKLLRSPSPGHDNPHPHSLIHENSQTASTSRGISDTFRGPGVCLSRLLRSVPTFLFLF